MLMVEMLFLMVVKQKGWWGGRGVASRHFVSRCCPQGAIREH